MPIHDQSYRRYSGPRQPPGRAWAVIAWNDIRVLLMKRLLLGVLLIGWAPVVVRAVMIYLSTNFPQMTVLAPSVATFREFFEQQGFSVFVMTVYVGAGLIANDRRANALPIYLSKPLTRAEYIGGKLVVLLFFLLLVTWVPAMLLLFLQMMFAGSFAFVRANLFLIPAITLFSFVQVLLASFTVLALSSWSNSARYVAMLYAAAVIFTDVIFEVLRELTGSSGLAWLSFRANLAQVGDVIFRLTPRYASPWPLALAIVAGLIVASAAVLQRRVRGVEVVA